ncbi:MULTISPECIES: HNH endonuclease signature motif containing protein [unclassified Gordonia (in: high G+C Gram-positive bacteria)]|uniref:HNH endonuclease signature motif containing protein n=1 Tax=unclassified Gordonia (in: high G+C Gram-positive bacteria) TaxID=2657482 RepID=UPI0010F9D3D7|nr:MULTISPECIES: HNH endonuclease signature motif containing protein [unclassified Gordonia (in: high G+C Gram-positive bacteria)]
MSSGAGAGSTAVDPSQESVEPRFRPDHELSASELVEVLNHCAGLAAASAHRMMVVASLIHDEREMDYAQRRAETHSGELDSIEAFEHLSARVAAGENPYEQFGPNGLEQAIAEVGATLTVTPAEAKDLIEAGDALRYRLSFTGHALACGRIDKRRFLIALKRTDLITDDEEMQTVDAHLAEAIFARPPMSTARFTAMVDSIVAKWAPDAIRRRKERVKSDRKVTVTPDRFTPGQSRISGTLPDADAAEFDARLTAMATAVHAGDPRKLANRRVDALKALSRGEAAITCLCDDCVITATEPDTAPDLDAATVDTAEPPTSAAEMVDADNDVDPSADVVVDDPAAPTDSASDSLAPRATFHIVVNLSTLIGLDDDPAFLDRHGIIDADTARTLLAEARRTYIHPAPDAPDGSPPPDADSSTTRYTPSKKLQALVRAGELCCTFPGCNAPVWQIDLDHTEPFDHADPRRGGPTDARNLKPLCRFHHRIKTFTSWQDHQDELQTAWFTTPTGHMFVGNAFSGRDLFNKLFPRRSPDHPARDRLTKQRDNDFRRHQRAEKRWNDANPPPF